MPLSMKAEFTRPLTVRVIALAYLLSPVANVLQASLSSGDSTDTVLGRALHGFGPLGTVLVLAAPLAGIGIYSGQRWGFVVFLLHALALLEDSAWRIGTGSLGYRAGIFAFDAVIVTAIVLVLREDIRAPFLSAEERGWRLGDRIPIDGVADVALEGDGAQQPRAPRVPVASEASIAVGGETVAVTLVNISRTGLLVRWPGTLPTVGDQGTVAIGATGASFRIRVVRLTGDGAGLAFVDADPKETEAVMRKLVARGGSGR